MVLVALHLEPMGLQHFNCWLGETPWGPPRARNTRRKDAQPSGSDAQNRVPGRLPCHTPLSVHMTVDLWVSTPLSPLGRPKLCRGCLQIERGKPRILGEQLLHPSDHGSAKLRGYYAALGLWPGKTLGALGVSTATGCYSDMCERMSHNS